MAVPLKPTDLVAAEIVARGPRPFAFRLMVPAKWKVAEVSEQPLSVDSPQPIAIFESTDNPLVSIQVMGIVLEHEIAAAKWLHYYIEQRGWGPSEVAAGGPRKGLAACALSVSGVDFWTEMTATVNGSTLILLQGMTPANRRPETEQALTIGVRSFSTQQVVDPNVIEPWTSIVVAAPVQFAFPASWRRRGPQTGAPGRTAVDLMRLDAEQAPQGIIRVKAVDRSVARSLEDEIAATRREFEDSGTTFVAPPLPRPEAPLAPFTRLLTFTSQAYTTPESPLHFQCWALGHAGGVVVVSCLGPSDEADFYQWAINIRAFEIAVGSLQA